MKSLPLLLIALVGLMSACQTDPCANALATEEMTGAGGAADLGLRIVEQSGAPGNRARALDCADVSVFNAQNYSDTLFAGRILLESDAATIRDLPVGRVDIVIDRSGYYPVKVVDQLLHSGQNQAVSRILLYPSDSKITLPGWLSVVPKAGTNIGDIRSLVGAVEGLKVHPSPQGWYELEIPVRNGVMKTRERAELLCRALIRSPLIANAQPMVTFKAPFPGG